MDDQDKPPPGFTRIIEGPLLPTCDWCEKHVSVFKVRHTKAADPLSPPLESIICVKCNERHEEDQWPRKEEDRDKIV